MATVKFSTFCGIKALLIVAPTAACSATSISSSAGNILNAYGPQLEDRRELLWWPRGDRINWEKRQQLIWLHWVNQNFLTSNIKLDFSKSMQQHFFLDLKKNKNKNVLEWEMASIKPALQSCNHLAATKRQSSIFWNTQTHARCLKVQFDYSP